MADQIVRALSPEGDVRIVAAVTTETAAEGIRRHGLDGVGAIALARGLTAGVLLATLTKGEERVTLQLMGAGPLRNVTVDARTLADGSAAVRGYVGRVVSLPVDEAHPRVGAALLGQGDDGTRLVSVLRDLGLKEQYRGQAPLVSGEIDEDVEAYLLTSEQIASAMTCAASVGPVRAAGVLAQCMPGGAEDKIEAIRARLRGGVVASALEAGVDAAELARAAFAGVVDVLDTRPVTFACACSRERVADALGLVADAELAAMIHEDGQAEITCNFCSSRYTFDRDALEAIRAQRGAPRGVS